MKFKVELSDMELAEILNLTGERKKGPVIRRLMEEALQQRRRAQIAQRFLSGEWGVELETYEADQECERQGTRSSPHDSAAQHEPLDRPHPCPQPGLAQAVHPRPSCSIQRPIWLNRCTSSCCAQAGWTRAAHWRPSSPPCPRS